MARYDFGVERRIYLHDLTEKEVDEAVAELVSQADEINNSVAGNWWGSIQTTIKTVTYSQANAER